MPWLFIDTHTAGECRTGMIGAKASSVRSSVGRSSTLLPLISSKIGRAALRSADGICVVSGPGSFSSVRGGVIVANLLARLFRKPLVGMRVEEAQDLSSLAKRLMANEIDALPIVLPLYDAEPNITVKKIAV